LPGAPGPGAPPLGGPIRPAAGTPHAGNTQPLGFTPKQPPDSATFPANPEEDEATVVGQAPADVLATASGEQKAFDDNWQTVYEDFIRTKRECGEPTDGLTFEKFSQTLKKNRDALIQRHGCKRVKFSVYVKEGRASLKATPVKE
jgi:hypothetical protein